MTIKDDQEAPPRAPSAAIAAYLRRSISLSDIAAEIWDGKWFVLAAIIAALLIGAYTVNKNPARYVATVQLAPAETDTGGRLSGSVGLLSGLIGGGNTAAVPKFTQFLNAIGSVGVAKILDEKYDMVCRIYRGQCDEATHSWKDRTGLEPWFRGILARIGRLPNPNGARTVIDLADHNEGAVEVIENKKNSLVRLNYVNTDPKFAERFLSLVVKTTNDYIREQNRVNQRSYVRYLRDAISKNTNVDQRQILDQLLLQEERNLMMTEVDVPYAASVVDGPTVTPLNKVFRTLMIDAFLGLLCGVAVLLGSKHLPRLLRWS